MRIDAVIQRLDDIIAETSRDNDRVGLFAALYRKVTVAIKDGIVAGDFDDGDRMDRLDERFAQRYFDALEAWRAGGRPSRCWNVAFKKTRRDHLILVQHFLLGINAHINLDLGIAAAETAPGDAIDALERDFDHINKILADLVDRVQEVVARFSPLMGILDAVGGRTDESIIDFSMEVAREEAWRNAQLLAHLDEAQAERFRRSCDRSVAVLARGLANPPFLLSRAIDVIGFAESYEVGEVARAIEAI